MSNTLVADNGGNGIPVGQPARHVKVTLDRVRPMSVPHGHGSSTAS